MPWAPSTTRALARCAAPYPSTVAVLLAVLSSLVWGSADFAGGLLARRRPAYAVVGGSQLLGLLAVGAVAVLTRAWDAPAGWLPWAMAAGLSGAAGLVCFYAALGSGTMGVVASISALAAVLPVLVGVGLGERLSVLAAVGIALAIAGVVAASGPEVHGGGSPRPIVLAGCAAVLFGLALTFIERGARFSVVLTLLGMRVTSVSLFVLAALTARTLGGLVARDLRLLAFVGVGDVSANLIYAVATQHGPLSVTGALGSLYPVMTVLLARLVLGERLRRLQQAGVVAAIGGVLLVSLG